jgi:hypothetical protein
VWELLWERASFLDGVSAETGQEYERRLVIGKFGATIDTVQNSANPIIMSASVGWANSAARQQYDWDETFRNPVSNRFQSTPSGYWMEVTSGEHWTDAEIVEACLMTLGEWLRTDGRYE